MSTGGQLRIKWSRNIAENINRLSRTHGRYRQTTDSRTDEWRRHIANVNSHSRSLQTVYLLEKAAFIRDWSL